jgi:hypothetical protein
MPKGEKTPSRSARQSARKGLPEDVTQEIQKMVRREIKVSVDSTMNHIKAELMESISACIKSEIQITSREMRREQE